MGKLLFVEFSYCIPCVSGLEWQKGPLTIMEHSAAADKACGSSLQRVTEKGKRQAKLWRLPSPGLANTLFQH